MDSRITDKTMEVISVKLKAMIKYFWFPLTVTSSVFVSNTNPVKCNIDIIIPNNKTVIKFSAIVCFFTTPKFLELVTYQKHSVLNQFSIQLASLFLSKCIFSCNILLPCLKFAFMQMRHVLFHSFNYSVYYYSQLWYGLVSGETTSKTCRFDEYFGFYFYFLKQWFFHEFKILYYFISRNGSDQHQAVIG